MAQKIAILGGSFDPAHEGHIYISKLSLKYLGADLIYWLPAWQNPFKQKLSQSAHDRLEKANQLIAQHHLHRKIKIIDWEIRNQKARRYQYLRYLRNQKQYLDHKFIQIFGLDNWQELHRWQHYHEIMRFSPIVIFPRKLAKCTQTANNSKLHENANQKKISKIKTNKVDFDYPQNSAITSSAITSNAMTAHSAIEYRACHYRKHAKEIFKAKNGSWFLMPASLHASSSSQLRMMSESVMLNSNM